MKLVATLTIAVLALPSISRAQSKAIELPKLVETFMVKPDSDPEWSMGASKSTPQIRWTSSGIESEPNCESYVSCRRGVVRVLLNGKEMQHLRQRLEPVPWELFMVSTSNAKFGPEEVGIWPSCDTPCEFDFKKAMNVKGFSLKQICKSGPAIARRIAYEVRKGYSRVHAVVTENVGSGGTSTSLNLFLHSPQAAADLCSEATDTE